MEEVGAKFRGTGFAGNMHVEIDGCFFCKRVVIGTRDGNNRGTLTNDSRDDSQQLGCGAGVRNRNDDIVFGDHAQIAVSCFCRMNEECRRSGGSERCCDLACNVPALADAADDNASLAVENQGDGFDKIFIKPSRDSLEFLCFFKKDVTS